MKSRNFHTPVLLGEVIDFLRPAGGRVYIDATIGGGGHSFALLQEGARVLGVDRDPESIDHVKRLCQAQTVNCCLLTLAKGNFARIGEIARQYGFTEVDGILFDLGVSAHQLESPKRGFSFSREGPLDMRMDLELNITAADIVNNFDERRLYEIIKTYGQEKYSRTIARAICSARQIGLINSTVRLAKIIEDVYPRGVRTKKINKATKTFQALRIVVNSELLNLESTLPQTTSLLAPGGRLVVISFHSLEDGQVKRFLKQEKGLLTLTEKPIGPGKSEIFINPRARSARLRVAEKI